MQYSIKRPIEQYWNDVIIETEQAIKKLEPRLQETYRIIAAKKLKKIKNSTHQKNNQAQRQNYILNNIKRKLRQGNAMITKADKGKTTVIIDNTEYNKKTLELSTITRFRNLTKTPQIISKKRS